MGYMKDILTTVPVILSTFNPADGATIYFGNHMYVTGVENLAKIYLPCTGTICKAVLNSYSVVATGTNEDWSAYVRLNGTTDYLIATTGAAADYRQWKNLDMSVPINAATDYVEIKLVNPTWVTNPEGVRLGGYLVLRT